MTRTDIHRPASAQFDPEGYRCEGVFDLAPGPWGAEQTKYRMQTIDRLVKAGFQFINIEAHGGRQCFHCGAHIRYAALMSHADTKTMGYVGEQCLDNRFDAGLTAAQFQERRKAAAAGAKRQKIEDQATAWLAERPAVQEVFLLAENAAGADEWKGNRGESDLATIQDMRWKLFKYGSLSERQENFLVTLGVRAKARGQRVAKQQAEAEVLIENGVSVPEGRVLIEGEIVSIRDQLGDWGPQLKALVRDDEGFKVWGTIPGAIADEVREQFDAAKRGEAPDGQTVRIRFTATVRPKDSDPLFGFWSRPTKAQVV